MRVEVEVCRKCVSLAVVVKVSVTVDARTEIVSSVVGVGLVPLPSFRGGDGDVCRCVVLMWTFPVLILTLS